jgi:hypothetical protein
VWFNRDENETWFGDGTSIIEKNFVQEHKDRTRERASEMANIQGRIITGIRPYIKGDGLGFFQRLSNNLIVSTGGAKNGTILAASHAIRLLEEL